MAAAKKSKKAKEAANAEVAGVIDRAVRRAQGNGRSTVRPSDL